MLKNNTRSYGSVAKFLHWLMAAWIVTAYVVIIWLTWDHEEGLIEGLNYHKAIGFTILLPFVVRLAWRLCTPQPQHPAGMPRWQLRISQVTHALLYFLMIAMPISGYLGNFGGVDYGIFQVPPFARTELAGWIFATFDIDPQQWDLFFDTFHYRIVGPYVFPVIVALHAGAALYHHFIQKDDVLRRMLPRRQAGGG
ncbi:MAG: cytochrome b [Gammaproteobacteria bacterium]